MLKQRWKSSLTMVVHKLVTLLHRLTLHRLQQILIKILLVCIYLFAMVTLDICTSLVSIGKIASGGTGGYESDDESPMQSAIEESLRTNPGAPKSTGPVSKGDTSKKPTVPSKFGTIGGLQNEENSSDEEGD